MNYLGGAVFMAPPHRIAKSMAISHGRILTGVPLLKRMITLQPQERPVQSRSFYLRVTKTCDNSTGNIIINIQRS
jgi:type IV secretory pathway protease TraF